MNAQSEFMAPVTRRVRAYFAPVNRTTGTPTIFDAAAQTSLQVGGFAVDSPPAPWVDLGWCTGFTRKSETKVEALRTGAPAIATTLVRTTVEASVALEFESWGKLQLALASGSQQMNLLVPASGAVLNGSGGVAIAAAALGAGSTSTSLHVGTTTAASFQAGDFVAIDVDYVAQVGYVGGGASGAYVKQAADVGGDANYIRRISLNVGRVSAITSGVLQLERPLLAGVPMDGMKVSRITGFVDREGGSFFHEWSALFCMEGEQGDRVLYYYPRLQSMQGAVEKFEALAGPLQRLKLAGAFRALPVIDRNDGSTVVCFRSYLPG